MIEAADHEAAREGANVGGGAELLALVGERLVPASFVRALDLEEHPQRELTTAPAAPAPARRCSREDDLADEDVDRLDAQAEHAVDRVGDGALHLGARRAARCRPPP